MTTATRSEPITDAEIAERLSIIQRRYEGRAFAGDAFVEMSADLAWSLNSIQRLLARIAELQGERARQDEAIVTMFAQLSAAREALSEVYERAQRAGMGRALFSMPPELDTRVRQQLRLALLADSGEGK